MTGNNRKNVNNITFLNDFYYIANSLEKCLIFCHSFSPRLRRGKTV
ncbi:MAG: hypothetical protein LBR79_01830 [Oscillospiraceae bacterium]|nr:hypothetical protein [Oscillospiraceae bacterium]